MGSNSPTKTDAEAVAEDLLEQIRGVEIVTLEHTEHSEGYEHRFHFEVEHPEGVDTSAIYQKNAVRGSSFKWVKAISGISESTPTSAEGDIRCYYGE